jgi:uncharacterized protein
LLLILLGLAAGILTGTMGMGGNVVLVPALIHLFGFDQHRAQGTTLALMSFPLGLFAAIEYHRRGLIPFSAVGWLLPGILVGSIVGARVALIMPAPVLRRGFGVFVLLVGLRMVFSK